MAVPTENDAEFLHRELYIRQVVNKKLYVAVRLGYVKRIETSDPVC